MTNNNHFRAEAKADEWGPEIKVEGKRPEWLEKGTKGMFENTPGHWLSYTDDLDFWSWDEGANDGKGCPIHIRLPANHPHYAQNAPETHRQGTNGVRNSQECLERMEALVRRMAAMHVDGMEHRIESLFIEADNIVHDLPEPADPDEAVADEIHSEWLDNSDGTRAVIMKALKRGRALERGDAAARSHGGM